MYGWLVLLCGQFCSRLAPQSEVLRRLIRVEVATIKG